MNTRHIKRQKMQFEETEQVSELDMAGMLELSDSEFKTMIHMLADKAVGMQKQMGNVSKRGKS